MVMHFINYENGSHDVLIAYYQEHHCGEDGTKFLFRQDGFQRNRYLISELKKQEKDSTVETIVYTDDETMLAYAQYDESIHNYKVFIEDEDTDEKFVPLYKRRPNIRIVNNLVSMCHKGLLDTEDFE